METTLFIVVFLCVIGVMVAAIKVQPVIKLEIIGDKIVFTIGKKSTVVPWTDVFNVAIVKSDITQTARWQYVSLQIRMQRTVSSPRNKIFADHPEQEPIWIIRIKYKDGAGHEQVMEYEKVYTDKSNLLLKEIITLAKQRGIPVGADEYLKANPWFQEKYLS